MKRYSLMKLFISGHDPVLSEKKLFLLITNNCCILCYQNEVWIKDMSFFRIGIIEISFFVCCFLTHY